MIMKRILTLIPVLAVALTSCNGTITEAEVRDHVDPVLPEPVSLSLSPGAVSVAYTSGGKDSTLVVTDQETVNIVISPDAASWLSYEFKDMKIYITVKEENPAEVERTGLITVIAGEGVEASSAEFSVIQGGAPVPVLKLSAADVKLGSDAGLKNSVSISETNLNSISLRLDDAAAAWCKAEMSGTVIMLTSIAANTDTLSRSGVLTVDGGRLAVEVALTQDGLLPPSRVGKPYGTEGIYIWRNPDNPREYMILSAKAEKRAWGPDNHTAGCPGTTYDTETACERIRANSDYATAPYALQFCDALGEGWNLPSRLDANRIFEAYNGLPWDDGKGTAKVANPVSITDAEKAARAAFDAVMDAIGGVRLNTMGESSAGDSIWLCSENSAGTNGWYFRFGSVGCSHGTKTSTARFARCVKTVEN